MDIDKYWNVPNVTYSYQLSQLLHIPNDIKAIINDPLPRRQVAPWEHNYASVEASEDINS